MPWTIFICSLFSIFRQLVKKWTAEGVPFCSRGSCTGRGQNSQLLITETVINLALPSLPVVRLQSRPGRESRESTSPNLTSTPPLVPSPPPRPLPSKLSNRLAYSRPLNRSCPPFRPPLSTTIVTLPVVFFFGGIPKTQKNNRSYPLDLLPLKYEKICQPVPSTA